MQPTVSQQGTVWLVLKQLALLSARFICVRVDVYAFYLYILLINFYAFYLCILSIKFLIYYY